MRKCQIETHGQWFGKMLVTTECGDYIEVLESDGTKNFTTTLDARLADEHLTINISDVKSLGETHLIIRAIDIDTEELNEDA